MKCGILTAHLPTLIYASSLNSASDWLGVAAGMKESSRLCLRGGGSNSLDPEIPEEEPDN